MTLSRFDPQGEHRAVSIANRQQSVTGAPEMWTSTFRHRETTEKCAHDRVSVTSFAGLRRTVCGTCGHVSVGHLHDSFEDLTVQLLELEEARNSHPTGD
jgi:hypothetical protein